VVEDTIDTFCERNAAREEPSFSSSFVAIFAGNHPNDGVKVTRPLSLAKV